MYFLLMFKLSFHLMKGEGKKKNMFVVKVPKQNFKQRSGRRGSFNVQAAFKSRFPPPPLLLGSLRLVNRGDLLLPFQMLL